MTKRTGAVLVALLLLLLAVTPTAAAGPKGTERPFKGWATGEATFLLDNPLDCPGPPAGGFGITTVTDATGNASHLGRTSVHSEHCPLLEGGITEGTMIFVAANGDELHTTYEGEATPLPPTIGDPIFVTTYMTVDPAASTGRFAGAEGEIVLHAELVFEGMEDPRVAVGGNLDGNSQLLSHTGAHALHERTATGRPRRLLTRTEWSRGHSRPNAMGLAAPSDPAPRGRRPTSPHTPYEGGRR